MALKIIEQGPIAAALRRENFPAGTLPGRHLVIANSAPPPDRRHLFVQPVRIRGFGFDSVAAYLVRGQFGQRGGRPYWHRIGAYPSADFLKVSPPGRSCMLRSHGLAVRFSLEAAQTELISLSHQNRRHASLHRQPRLGHPLDLTVHHNRE